MRNGLFVFPIAIFGVALALAQSSTTPKKTAAKKTAVKKKSTSTKKSGTKTAAKAAPAWHPRQMTPTPERYKEIQQALADKGYLKTEPTGVWDQQSIDALRQFQTDQKLSVTGRISSASLINLGLGPKTNSETPAPVPPAIAPPPENQ